MVCKLHYQFPYNVSLGRLCVSNFCNFSSDPVKISSRKNVAQSKYTLVVLFENLYFYYTQNARTLQERRYYQCWVLGTF